MSCTHKHCKINIYENNKCIFHCEKTIQNGWLTSSNDKYDKCNTKIELFWKEFFNLHEKNITEHMRNQFFSDGFIIPFYHSNLIDGASLTDIRKLKKLSFFRSIFVDSFVIRDGTELDYLSFNGCSFHDNINLEDLNLSYLSLLNNQLDKQFIMNSVVINNGEMMNFKSISESKLSEDYVSIVLQDITIKKKFEIWKFDDKNIDFNISSCNFHELEIKEMNINKIEFSYNKFKFKFKIIDVLINDLHINNSDFETDSKILFENIKSKNFSINQLSQDSKYIQINHIEIIEKFDINKIEFKNTYFNNINLVNAEKVISKISFIGSHLNSIEWGNIGRIKAERDIFRELKYIYDEQESFIDANNFFAMEMNSYKNELSTKKFFSNHWQEKLTFYINKKISNFSQSWFLPLLWIFMLNFSFYIFAKVSISDFSFLHSMYSLITIILLFIIIMFISEISKSFNNKNISTYVFPHFFIIISMISIINYFDYGTMTDVLLFSHIQSYKDFTDLTKNFEVFKLWTIHKIILGFLIYHFVISLRRQTKR